MFFSNERPTYFVFYVQCPHKSKAVPVTIHTFAKVHSYHSILLLLLLFFYPNVFGTQQISLPHPLNSLQWNKNLDNKKNINFVLCQRNNNFFFCSFCWYSSCDTIQYVLCCRPIFVNVYYFSFRRMPLWIWSWNHNINKFCLLYIFFFFLAPATKLN